ncbi:dephospho-CoA kinase [Leucobacter sp. gxy201]|uniref:dephospho-CoA kinase n=1 Tax=Leucobacter sp. gxy201 TaxID=2957200 RepID=UPI003DA142C2
MQLIALTGGIAAGKSTIGDRFAQLGAVRIDADRLSRDAVAPATPGLARVIERFGPEVIATGGELDRAKLGGIVFGDASALADLNAIVHPEVQRLLDERLAEVERCDPDVIVVYEIPLLAETGKTRDYDLVVVADAPEEQRVQRMIELRGMTESEARGRIANQAGDEARRRLADVVIDTSRTRADTIAQVDALWARLTRRPA